LTGERRKVAASEELRDLCVLLARYFPVMYSRTTRWVGHVARVGEKRNAYSVLVGKRVVKGSVAGNRRRWENLIKMDVKEIGWEDMD
jgi:hypothetical protein